MSSDPPIPSVKNGFFSNDPNGSGFNFHDTAEEAQQEAQAALECEQGLAGDGWSEEVTCICWGKVQATVQETSRRNRTEEDTHTAPNIDEIVEYELLPPGN